MIHALKDSIDIYRTSFLQVICNNNLTDPIQLQIGIKTGCPWSAANFILAINSWLRWLQQCAPAGVRSPNPVQGYADDIQIASRQECVIQQMLTRTEMYLRWSRLEVKQAKCAVFYERRSWGNRWYSSKSDKPPSFTILQEPMRVYSRHETYPYLGHKFNIAGSWEEQLTELTIDYSNRLDLIDISPLPTIFKLQAIREIALAKVQHLFANLYIPQTTLKELNDKTVRLVRKWVGINTHSTRDIIFQSRRDGGLGVSNIEWVYTATRTSHLLNMLNNSDRTVREMAHASLIQHLGKRKIPFAKENDEQFLGFKVKSNGKLDNRAAGFGVRSDWLDLNDLCHRTGLRLEWARTDSATIAFADIIADPLIYPRATYELSQERRELPLTTARAVILSMKRTQSAQHWKGLRLQGKLACLSFVDQSLSHTIYSNASIGEDVLIFTIKARLQVLPTKSNLSTWYPSSYDPHCILHPTTHDNETIAHILNGCNFYKGMHVHGKAW